MEESAYTAIKPREADPANGRLFAFYRLRNGATTRFFPGDGARLKYVSRDADTLEIPGVPAEFLLRGDKVRVEYRGRCVFLGDVVSRTEHKSRGTDAVQSVVCAGPWSKMARMTYRQYWRTGSGYELSSRLILNQTQSGKDQNLNSELREIAAHAASACGYTVGTVDVSSQQLPYDECRDITVADAIRRELKLFPSANCRFDYSAATPRLDIVKPSSDADAAYVAAIPKTARSYEYNAHPITGVDLEIETTGDVDGVPYRVLNHQRAGDTSAGNPDCLYATLQLAGFSSSSVKQSFTAEVELNPQWSNPGWWYYRHPRLANVAMEAVSITNCKRSGSADAGDYPNIAKQTVGELKAAGLRARVETFTCECTITTDDDVEEKIHLQMQYVTTNATNRTYTWVASSSSTTGETVPDGLAAAILAERSGELRAERMTVRCGDSLPQLGDRCDGLFLTQIEIDCAELTADLHFGAPEFLSVDDMASLLSNFRNKRRTTLATSRVEGKPDDGAAEVEMGPIPPLSSTEFAPGTKAKTTIGGSDGSSRIKLDPSKLDEGKDAELHKLTVKKNGEEAECQILATEDIEIEIKSISAGEGVDIEETDGVYTISVKKEEEEPETPEGSDEPIVPGNEPSPSPSGGGGGSCGCDCDCCSGGDDEEGEQEAADGCDHPGSSGGPGGVSKGGDPVHYNNYDPGGAGGHGGDGGGGVAAEDEPHEGSDDCCTG